MSGLWTHPPTDVDPLRFLGGTAIGGGGAYRLAAHTLFMPYHRWCLYAAVVVVVTLRLQENAMQCVSYAYGPADATAIPKPDHLLPHLNPDWFYLSGTGYPCCPGKEAVLWQF